MMSAEVESRILGWSPPDNEEFVNVPVPTGNILLALQNPTFHISEPNPIKRLRRTTAGIPQAASPAESSTSDHSSNEAPTDTRADLNGGKHTDPAWVARPRNEFILFRCDYVRKHSREGKRVRRAPGAEVEKTLSKQAAEAWHHLSPEERLYWKECANGERNEHARRYPDYRYRPKKNATGRRRQSRCFPSKPAASNKDSTPSANGDESETRTSNQAALSIAQQSSSSSKGTPRRYASVPELNVAEPVHRRLRSTASHDWIGVTSSSASQGNFAASSREFMPMPQLTDNIPFEPCDYISPEYALSPAVQPVETTLQTSRSLLNWNDARMVSAPLQSTQFLSSTSVSILGPPSLEMTSSHALSEYTTGGNPEPVSDPQMFALGSAVHYTTQGDIWMSQPELQYPNRSDQNANRVASANGVGPEPVDIQPIQVSSDIPASSTPNTVYGSGGGTLALQVMVDYGLSPSTSDSNPVDLLRSGSGSSQENLFAMDTDDFFIHNF